MLKKASALTVDNNRCFACGTENDAGLKLQFSYSEDGRTAATRFVPDRCYQGWKDGFYAGVPRRAWLSHCASLMNSIEVNATFYGRQKPNTYERWLQQTPPAFRFSVKANRYLTHIRKLQDPLQSRLCVVLRRVA